MALTFIDTHCHLDFDAFNDDLDQVMDRAREAGISRIIVPGLDLPSSRAAIALADKYDEVYAAVGFHPNSIGNLQRSMSSELDLVIAMAKHPKVVAIGEIGLDYYWDNTPQNIQMDWLQAQLAIAHDLKLPVILHNRDSTRDLLAALKGWVNNCTEQPTGVLHSFSGSLQDALDSVGLGFHIGFTGPVTFKNAHETRSIAAKLPPDRILIETDAPFLTPVPHRGKRNEPAYVHFVAAQIAKVRDESVLEVAQFTSDNAVRLFRLDPA